MNDTSQLAQEVADRLQSPTGFQLVAPALRADQSASMVEPAGAASDTDLPAIASGTCGYRGLTRTKWARGLE